MGTLTWQNPLYDQRRTAYDALVLAYPGLVSNWTFSSGLNGWTNVAGTDTWGTTGDGYFDGDCLSFGSSSDGVLEQVIGVSEHATAIDTGSHSLRLLWAETKTANGETFNVAVEFRDASNVALGRIESGVHEPGTTDWQLAYVDGAIPVNTRSFAVRIESDLFAGGAHDARVDAISVSSGTLDLRMPAPVNVRQTGVLLATRNPAYVAARQTGVLLATYQDVTVERFIRQSGVLAGTRNPTQKFLKHAPVYTAVHEVPDLSFTQPDGVSWSDCVRHMRLPECISEGSLGGPRLNTEIATATSGYEERRARWVQAKGVWDITYGVQSLEELQELISFFRICKGKMHGFRFKDPMDYTSSQVFDRDHQPVTPQDQVIGTGDAIATAFQLKKTYEFGGETVERKITRPVAGTVVVSIDNEEVTNWNVNTSSGVVTFTPRHAVTGTDIALIEDAGTYYIESTATDLSGFQAGDEITLSGFATNVFANTKTNRKGDVPDETFLVTAATTNRLTLSGTRSETAASGDSVTVEVHPAPRQFTVIRAGYEFDVPCRFNSDYLPLSLDRGNLGGVRVEIVEMLE